MLTLKNSFLVFFLIVIFSCGENSTDKLIVAAADKLKVVYVGVENPIDVAISGIDEENTIVKADTAVCVIKGKNGKYSLKVNGKQELIKLMVYKVDNNRNELLMDSVEFRVKHIPTPLASIIGITGQGAISKSKLLESNFISTNLDKFDFEVNMPIVYFVMTIPVNGKNLAIEEDSPKINTIMKKYLSSVKEGDKIFIEDVYVRTLEGERRKIQGLVLKVR
jgi:hypothetical protein